VIEMAIDAADVAGSAQIRHANAEIAEYLFIVVKSRMRSLRSGGGLVAELLCLLRQPFVKG
jgi:hypothetical protein